MTVHPRSTQETRLDAAFNDATLLQFDTGDTIARPNEFCPQILRIRSGQARALKMSLQARGPLTLQRLEPGQWIGLTNLLNGEPCEWVSAAEPMEVEAINAETFSRSLWSDQKLLDEVLAQAHPQMVAKAISNWLITWPSPPREPMRL